MFASGHPDANLDWKLYGPSGILASGPVVVAPDAVSINLQVAAENNTVPQGYLLDYRDLTWTYTVDGAVVNGEIRYNLEARLPLAVSVDGVRRKLGVDPIDLPDGDISLVKAYLSFAAGVNADALAASLQNYVVAEAIEATAALALIPTMPMRVAASEESGTDKFKRQTIDWQAVAIALNDIVLKGVLIVDPLHDETVTFGSLLILAGPTTDAFTGA